MSKMLIIVVVLFTVCRSQYANANEAIKQQKHQQAVAIPPSENQPSPGFEEAVRILFNNIDQSVDPCTDFYTYACGKWMKSHNIPKHVSWWGTFPVAREEVQKNMKDILEEPIKHLSSVAEITRKYYQTCVDIEALNKLKSKPLRNELKKLGGWPLLKVNYDSYKQKPPRNLTLTDLLAQVKAHYGVDPFWSISVSADIMNTSQTILYIDQPMLSVRGRDNFVLAKYKYVTDALRTRLIETAKTIAQDHREEKHSQKQPINAEKLEADATRIVDLERSIGNISSPAENRRNATALYNLWTIGDLKKNVPKIDWQHYLKKVLPPAVSERIHNSYKIVVNEPRYLADLNKLLTLADETTVVNYVVWTAVLKLSELLDNRFQDIKQGFHAAYEDRKQIPDRWKTCSGETITKLDRGTSALFVDRYFSEVSKDQALHMVGDLMNALKGMIKDNKWMDEETKAAALVKLSGVRPVMGYPDYVKDPKQMEEFHKGLVTAVKSDDGYFQLRNKVVVFDQNANFLKLLKPTERTAMEKSSAQVNAWYNQELNLIEFPAGILQPPFFKGDFPKAVNYGAIGSIIGHELTHGFDDEGAQYDKDGNVRNWWSEKSEDEFEKRKKCFIEQYSSYEVEQIHEMHIASRTVGEDVADNGGLREAHRAYMYYLSREGEERFPSLNLTSEQMFFVSYALPMCKIATDKNLRNALAIDPHSPNRLRVNGALSNFEAFSKAFQCEQSSQMINPSTSNIKKCVIW